MTKKIVIWLFLCLIIWLGAVAISLMFTQYVLACNITVLTGIIVMITVGKIFFPRIYALPNWPGINSLSDDQQFLIRLPKLILAFIFTMSTLLFFLGIVLIFKEKALVVFAIAIGMHIFAWILYATFLSEVPSGSVAKEKVNGGENLLEQATKSKTTSEPMYRGILMIWGKYFPDVIVPPTKYFRLAGLWKLALVNVAKYNSDFVISKIVTKSGALVTVEGSVSWWADYLSDQKDNNGNYTESGKRTVLYIRAGGQTYALDSLQDKIANYIGAAAEAYELREFAHLRGPLTFAVAVSLCDKNNKEHLPKASDLELPNGIGAQGEKKRKIVVFPEEGTPDDSAIGVRIGELAIKSIVPEDSDMLVSMQEPAKAKLKKEAAATLSKQIGEHLDVLEEHEVTANVASLQAHALLGEKVPDNVRISEYLTPDLKGAGGGILALLKTAAGMFSGGGEAHFPEPGITEKKSAEDAEKGTPRFVLTEEDERLIQEDDEEAAQEATEGEEDEEEEKDAE